MKLVFVDEFKEDKKNHRVYGLSMVLIDVSSYARFKKCFYVKLKELGWDEKIEIKGRYSFSKKGDEKISVGSRLKFVEKLFELSKSSSDKYASAKVYYTLDLFPVSMTETEMYSSLLIRILKKLPKGLKSGNKNGKNNIIIFIDNNESINIRDISCKSEKILNERNLFLTERCINLCSGNDTPGIIFVDHVAYFVHNYIKTKSFNETNKERIKLLIGKFSEDVISSPEQKELENFIISFKKEQKSVDLLKALKKMIFIK